jgi:hypothetical protein
VSDPEVRADYRAAFEEDADVGEGGMTTYVASLVGAIAPSTENSAISCDHASAEGVLVNLLL